MRIYFRTSSTPWPICSCTVFILLFSYVSQTHSTASMELSLSKIPSHARTKKSVESSIVNTSMSGSAMTTFGFPPYFGTLASMSPKVRETLSLPGNTLSGPRIVCVLIPPYWSGTFAVDWVWYMCPPLFCYPFLFRLSIGPVVMRKLNYILFVMDPIIQISKDK